MRELYLVSIRESSSARGSADATNAIMARVENARRLVQMNLIVPVALVDHHDPMPD
jgi:hypothetical protein